MTMQRSLCELCAVKRPRKRDGERASGKRKVSVQKNVERSGKKAIIVSNDLGGERRWVKGPKKHTYGRNPKPK